MDKAKPLKDLWQAWYESRGLPPDGGDSLKWVDFSFYSIPLPFPNSDARRGAVRFHDLHHLLTGYATDIQGEGEIASWELAGGCGRFWVAWHLNLLSFCVGLILNPRHIWRAFIRGRNSRTLYRGVDYQWVLQQPLHSTRAMLSLNGTHHSLAVTLNDILFFAGTSLLSLVVTLLTAVAVLNPVSIALWLPILLLWKRQAKLAA